MQKVKDLLISGFLSVYLPHNLNKLCILYIWKELHVSSLQNLEENCQEFQTFMPTLQMNYPEKSVLKIYKQMTKLCLVQFQQFHRTPPSSKSFLLYYCQKELLDFSFCPEKHGIFLLDSNRNGCTLLFFYCCIISQKASCSLLPPHHDLSLYCYILLFRGPFYKGN